MDVSARLDDAEMAFGSQHRIEEYVCVPSANDADCGCCLRVRSRCFDRWPWRGRGCAAALLGAVASPVVTVHSPLYGAVRLQLGRDSKTVIPSIMIPFPHYNLSLSGVDGGRCDDVQYHFIDRPELFDRKGLYARHGGDYQDNWGRLGPFFPRVLLASKQLGMPEVFHAHDWQTVLLPVDLRTLYVVNPALRSAGAVLTVHNAGYQGWFPPQTIERSMRSVTEPNGKR